MTIKLKSNLYVGPVNILPNFGHYMHVRWWSQSTWWVLMAWRLFGARTSTATMMTWPGQCISEVPQRNLRPCGPSWVDYASVMGCIWYAMMTSWNWTFFALLALCAGNSPVTGELPIQRVNTGDFDVSFLFRFLLKLLSNNLMTGELRLHDVHVTSS